MSCFSGAAVDQCRMHQSQVQLGSHQGARFLEGLQSITVACISFKCSWGAIKVHAFAEPMPGSTGRQWDYAACCPRWCQLSSRVTTHSAAHPLLAARHGTCSAAVATGSTDLLASAAEPRFRLLQRTVAVRKATGARHQQGSANVRPICSALPGAQERGPDTH